MPQGPPRPAVALPLGGSPGRHRQVLAHRPLGHRPAGAALGTLEGPPETSRTRTECAGSTRAREILDNWQSYRTKFAKVMPVEYRRALREMEQRRMRIAAE